MALIKFNKIALTSLGIVLSVAIMSLTQVTFANTFNAESMSFAEKNKKWRELNTPLLNKKIPLFFKDASPDQIADTSTPTNEEKIELTLLLKQQREFFENYEQVISRHIQPKDKAMKMVAFNKYILAERAAASKKLYDGEMKFGEYVAMMRSLDLGKNINNFEQDQKEKAGIAEAKEKCISLGFSLQTEGFGKCVLQLSK